MGKEVNLERECRSYVEVALHGKLVKTKIISTNGFPDRMLLVPHCPVVLVEFKVPGETLRKNQLRWKKWLEQNGFRHWVIKDFQYFASRADRMEAQYAIRK